MSPPRPAKAARPPQGASKVARQHLFVSVDPEGGRQPAQPPGSPLGAAPPLSAAELRHVAETRLQHRSAAVDVLQLPALPAEPAATDSGVARLRLLHELQVHQVELELQNEELQRARDVLEAEVARYTELYDFAPVGYVTLDRSGSITQANLVGAGLLGAERGRLAGRRFAGFLRAADRLAFNPFLQQVFDSDTPQTCELALQGELPAGAVPRWVLVKAARAGSGSECRLVMSDISALKQTAQALQAAHQDMAHSYAQLEHMAHYDGLTQLPNRTLLTDRLQQALLHSQRRDIGLALAYLDLDGFKPVNDVHGHAVGDELLITLAQRMKQALREGDTLARIGGDEFVALLVDLDHAFACAPVLARLLQAAATPVTLGGAVLQVSASIGVTLSPHDGADADLLLRHADQAMYLAKQAGRNRYHFFDVARDAAVVSQRENLARVQLGLAQHEFVLHYQPRVNMQTGDVIGAEALIRWRHPERGLLLPATFLPIIDEHPFSITLGEWVLASALAQLAAWQAAGLRIAVSVNVGALQLQQADFVSRLQALLAAQPDVEPARLTLEVLETHALQDITQISAVMRDCQAIGVRFALDDFGIGYASMTYLKRLPADQLKIDRSFVYNMIDDPDDLAIVQSVIGLAGAFHRQVVAEGVETAAHGARLLLLGCVQAQGYGIARPMEAAELPAWVADWHAQAVWTAWSAAAPALVSLAAAAAPAVRTVT